MLKVKRKAYTTKRGVHVKATSFSIKDRGKIGKGPKLITIKRKGIFGEGFMSMPVIKQHKILKTSTKKYGEKSTQGRLQAISTFNKNVNPTVSKKASGLRTWVAKNFEGKKYIGR
jgi:hypothetical protein